jgi:broad specificity phosphatase PhoE
MEIVLVRHGQPDWEPDGRARDEPELTALGRAQAEATARALAAERFDALYVSPLRRARATAEPIEKALGLPARVEGWLAELRLPSLEGTPLEEVQRFFARMRMRDLPEWWNGPEGGESFRHFHERVTTGIEEVLGSHGARRLSRSLWSVPEGERRLLVVAHGGSIAVSLAHLLGIDPEPFEADRFQLGWTGISRLRTLPTAGAQVWSLQSFNARAHLAGLPDPPG